MNPSFSLSHESASIWDHLLARLCVYVHDDKSFAVCIFSCVPVLFVDHTNVLNEFIVNLFVRPYLRNVFSLGFCDFSKLVLQGVKQFSLS